MSNIGDWLGYEVYPALFEIADRAFPEHQFIRNGDKWISKTYLDGTPHKSRKDKTIISSKAPYCILEQGGEAKSIYRYLIERDRLTDKQLLEKLSELTGIPLPKGDFTESQDYKERLNRATILEDAQSYFVYCLQNSKNVKDLKEYLQVKRGYSEENIEKMELGYIPSQEQLYKYLIETKKHKEDQVKEALKLSKAIGETHSLTIPFREPTGQIKGFIVRSIDKRAEPKYYYSTGLEKSKSLFNLKAIKGDKDLAIVEGVLDALNSEAQGINNVVALGGTSLNEDQIKEAIRRGAKKFTLCLDNDTPGKEATFKAIENLEQFTEIPIYVAYLPDGIKDPDELIKEQGAKPLKEAIEKAIKSHLYKLDFITDKYLKIQDEKGELTNKVLDNYLEEVTETASRIKSPIDRGPYIKEFLKKVEHLGITEKTIEATVDKLSYKKAREDQREEYRELLKEATELSNKGDINKALELLSKQSKQILQKDKENAFSKLLLSPTEDQVKEHFIKKPLGLKTGISIGKVDLELPSGALSIIAAPTSHGKTTMLINLLLNTAERYLDKSFYFFSYEEDGNSILVKTLNTYLNKPLNNSGNNTRLIEDYFRTGSTQYIKQSLIDEFISSKDIFFKNYIETKRININYSDFSSEELVQAIRYLNKNSNVGGIFIDYIQLLKKREGKYFSRQDELSKVCEELKDVSVDTGLPIILAAQFNRTVQSLFDLAPNNIREAGDIEHSANLILGMWQEGKAERELKSGEENDKGKIGIDEGEIYSKILKNRAGVSEIEDCLFFNGNTGKIENRDSNNKHKTRF